MKNKLKILYVTPEVFPFASRSDLADVASSYPKFIKGQGHDIRVMMPKYKHVNDRKYVLRDVIRLQGLKVKIGEDDYEANGKSAFIPNSKVQVYFLDNKQLFAQDDRYSIANDEATNYAIAQRFIFFNRACLETLRLLHWQPDIIHCNNWQAALIPLFLKTAYASDSFFENSKTLLSIHDPSQTGGFSEAVSGLLGLEENHGFQKFIDKKNGFNFLLSGVRAADAVSLTEELPKTTVGSAQRDLASLIKPRDAFVGMGHGIDSQVWNPESDKHLESKYSLDDLPSKLDNKKKLLEMFELTASDDLPVLSLVLQPGGEDRDSKWLEQLDSITELNLRLAILCGADHEEQLTGIRERHAGKVSFLQATDPQVSHMLEAGSDMSLKLGTERHGRLRLLHSMAYGAIPLVAREASPTSAIHDFDPSTGTGTGFIFESGEPVAAVRRAVDCYGNKESWNQLVRNAMSEEHSWDISAQKYLDAYYALMDSKDAEK